MIGKSSVWESVLTLLLISIVFFAAPVTAWGDALCPAKLKIAESSSNTYVVGGQTADEQTYKAAQAVSDGLSLFNSGQTDLALKKLYLAVQLAPSMPQAHHDLGYVLSKLGKATEAIAEFKKAIDLHDDTESAWLSLGGLYQSSGQLSFAIQTLQGFLTNFPTSTQYNKIASLVQGLQHEYQLQQASGNVLPASGAEPSDYFAAATATGATRWLSRSMPLAVYITDGSSVPFYHPEYADILKSAFLDWSSACQGLISFIFVNNPSQAVINCSWTNDASSLSNVAEAGEAEITKENGYIISARIKILTVPLSPELPVTPNRTKSCCLHEVGHALGIGGHSLDPADIMFASAVLSDDPRSISARDRNTLLRLYSAVKH